MPCPVWLRVNDTNSSSRFVFSRCLALWGEITCLTLPGNICSNKTHPTFIEGTINAKDDEVTCSRTMSCKDVLPGRKSCFFLTPERKFIWQSCVFSWKALRRYYEDLKRWAQILCIMIKGTWILFPKLREMATGQKSRLHRDRNAPGILRNRTYRWFYQALDPTVPGAFSQVETNQLPTRGLRWLPNETCTRGLPEPPSGPATCSAWTTQRAALTFSSSSPLFRHLQEKWWVTLSSKCHWTSQNHTSLSREQRAAAYLANVKKQEREERKEKTSWGEGLLSC